jgi:very-short-patch-repair endonuclease
MEGSLDEVIAALAAAQELVFSRAQAAEAGAHESAIDRRLWAGRWLRTSVPAVYALPGWVPTWRSVLVAASLKGAVPSHRAAAALWGLREGSHVEVTVQRGTNHRLGPHVRVHQSPLDRRDRARVGGVPVTTVERTLVDLAAVAPEAAVENALESALRLRLTTVERVAGRLRELAAPGRPGVAGLRAVLARRGVGPAAGSDLETRVIRMLRAAGIPDPVRQHEVEVGGRRYKLDLAWPECRLGIELDGFESHGGRQAFSDDRARQNALVLAGWTLLRYSGDQVRDGAGGLVAEVVVAMAA